jgi:hypothetical protein
MNNNNLSQATNNDVVCEAVGCYARANTKLPVKVGSQETIYLFLCDNCKPKFHSSSDQDVKESKSEVRSN